MRATRSSCAVMPAKAAESTERAWRPCRRRLDRYIRASRARPLASLAFVIPLLLLYEGGIIILGPQAVRQRRDVWLRQFLDALGFSQYLLLPAADRGPAAGLAPRLAREVASLGRRGLRHAARIGRALGLMLVAVARIEGMLVAGGPAPAAE